MFLASLILYSRFTNLIMKRIALIAIVFLLMNVVKAQEIYFNTGKNLSTYNFSDAANETVNLKSDMGNSFEIGLVAKPELKLPLYFSFGIGLNEYNATGYYNYSNLTWKTNYLGINGEVHYPFINNDYNILALNVGVGAETLVHGNQNIDGVNYDLTKYEEFKGLVLNPQLGLNYSYFINDDFNLNLQYGYSKHFNLSNKSTQKLDINNHGIQIGFSINIR